MKRLIYALMALLGFGMVGCEGEDRAAPEYGCPYVNFNLKARVVDEAGEPIPGIEVRLNNDWGKLAESDNLGEIDALGSTFPGNQYEIIFKDVDGAENGGEFETLVLDITDKVEQTAEGEGSWYAGDYKAELGDVTLTRKE